MALRSIERGSGQKTLLSAIAILAVIGVGAMIIAPTMTLSGYAQETDGDEEEQQEQPSSTPRLKDGALEVELVTDGLQNPTSMDFIGNDGNMIILQKENGEAVLVSTNGTDQDDDRPVVVDVPVNSDSERGFLGIAVADSQPENNGKTYVFLYFTESNEEGSEDESNEEGAENIRNRVYRYEWDAEEQALTRPELILDLPAEPGPNHDGGKLIVAKDGANASGSDNSGDYHLYAVIGDLNRDGMLQNFKDASEAPDDTSVVLRLTLDGAAPSDNPFLTNADSDDRLSKYFAYGIRNSFGLDVDPLTGTLWMTENGPANYDEINVVKPGFNSGWQRIIGPVETSNKTTDDLVQLDGSHYADPVFSWRESIGITDIEFLDSQKLGTRYANNIFVGDINNGNLYLFTVNESRTGINSEDGVDGTQNVRGGLLDLVAHNPDELSAITFGTGFEGGITDIETGPDGYLYVLAFGGQLYRIVPSNQ